MLLKSTIINTARRTLRSPNVVALRPALTVIVSTHCLFTKRQYTTTNMPVATEQQGRQIPLWINGEDVVTSKVFDVQHPSTGKVSSKVCGASEDDVYVLPIVLSSSCC